MIPVCTFRPYLPNIRYNFMFPSTSRPSDLSPPFTFLDLYLSFLFCHLFSSFPFHTFVRLVFEMIIVVHLLQSAS